MAKQREIGIAVIGVGWIGQVHCQAYRQILDVYPECTPSYQSGRAWR